MHGACAENPGKQPVDPRGYNRPSGLFTRCPKSTVDPTSSIFPPGCFSFLANVYMPITLQC